MNSILIGKLRDGISRVRKANFSKGVLALSAGAGLAQIGNLLAAPVLTRLYRPEDYGILGVFTSLSVSVAALSCLRYDQAIPLPEDNENGEQLLHACLRLTLVATVLSAMGLAIFGHQTLKMLDSLNFERYLWLLPCGIAATAVFRIYDFWAIRERCYRVIAKAKVIQTISSLFAQLCAGVLLRGNPAGLVLGQIVSFALGSFVLRSGAWLNRPRAKANGTAMLLLLKRYKKFPLFSTWSGLLKIAGTQFPMLVIAGSFGTTPAGLYAFCQRIIGLPMSLLADSVSRVFLAEAANARNVSIHRLRSLFLKTFLFQGLAAVILIAPLALAGPFFLEKIFGGDWTEAGHYVRNLSLMYLFQLALSPFDSLLDILERQELQLVREGLRAFMILSALLYAAHTKVDGQTAMLYLSMGGSLAFILGFMISLWCLSQAKESGVLLD